MISIMVIVKINGVEIEISGFGNGLLVVFVYVLVDVGFDVVVLDYYEYVMSVGDDVQVVVYVEVFVMIVSLVQLGEVGWYVLDFVMSKMVWGVGIVLLIIIVLLCVVVLVVNWVVCQDGVELGLGFVV